ncbi:hypothetical protein QBC40DRAFT_7416 [Triangularia verruculosa]|uniref:Uncharacterized protein n=1 Tax=Triangularia verruculosa TaxID=2587418 RepID=A0AAN6X9A6_9PEZI|nr:hypothetical protein QBC40DRAFT_7416 [Triangularia verruculosa]
MVWYGSVVSCAGFFCGWIFNGRGGGAFFAWVRGGVANVLPEGQLQEEHLVAGGALLGLVPLSNLCFDEPLQLWVLVTGVLVIVVRSFGLQLNIQYAQSQKSSQVYYVLTGSDCDRQSSPDPAMRFNSWARTHTQLDPGISSQWIGRRVVSRRWD